MYEEAKHADFFDRYWRGGHLDGRRRTGLGAIEPRHERWFNDPYIELFDRNRKAQFRLLGGHAENRAGVLPLPPHGRGNPRSDGVLRDADLLRRRVRRTSPPAGSSSRLYEDPQRRGPPRRFGMNQLKEAHRRGRRPRNRRGDGRGTPPARQGITEDERFQPDDPRNASASRTGDWPPTRSTNTPIGCNRSRTPRPISRTSTSCATRGRRLTERGGG